MDSQRGRHWQYFSDYSGESVRSVCAGNLEAMGEGAGIASCSIELYRELRNVS